MKKNKHFARVALASIALMRAEKIEEKELNT